MEVCLLENEKNSVEFPSESIRQTYRKSNLRKENVCSLRTTSTDIRRRRGGLNICSLQQEDCLFFLTFAVCWNKLVVEDTYGGTGWWWVWDGGEQWMVVVGTVVVVLDDSG
ncbi:hypothetical protein QVD17_23780 [Tagetes erecta]|uniref:Uncharacterized protein n=1 Tax=Tagetes erecta TaxID=13708 RepID=A0AAD8NU95_TARER|nr:hypothetical protein QVD17_23780 [Tagetes erecta]